ncbi:MAG TPA: HEAT repeat domain-containing protein [Planctomycetes bacterium]|nr:HEAT repeat domain-containing protein [Planctomycetota bacterium]
MLENRPGASLALRRAGKPRNLALTRGLLAQSLLFACFLLAPLGAQAGSSKAPSTQGKSPTTPLLMAPENAWLFVRVPLEDGKIPALLRGLPGNLPQLSSSWRTWARKAFGAKPEDWKAVEISLLHASEGEYPEGTILFSFQEEGASPTAREERPPSTRIQKIPAPFSGQAQWAMAKRGGRVWISNHPTAVRNALRLQEGETGSLFQDPALASLWKNAPAPSGEITLFLRSLGVRNRLRQAPLGASLRRLLKSPLGRRSGILLRKSVQDGHEEWTLLGDSTTPRDEADSPGAPPHKAPNIPQIEERSWLWISQTWTQGLKDLEAWGQIPAPLPLLPSLAETIRGALGDQERRAWEEALGEGLLWLGPLPEQKGSGVLVPAQDPKAIRKALRAAGARPAGPKAGSGSSSHFLWESGKGKLQIEILDRFLLLATPGFDLGGLDLEGNTQDLPGNTFAAGSLSGTAWSIHGLPNSMDFQAERDPQGTIKILLKNSDGTLPLWANLSRALGKKTARDQLELAGQEDPELLEAILGTLRLETDPKKALAAITTAEKAKDLETLRAYAQSAQAKISSRAIEALGTLKDQGSAGLFEKGVAQDQPQLLRKAAAYGLSRMGTPKARALLRDFILDSDLHVRLYALKAQSPKDLDAKTKDKLLRLVDTWTKDQVADRSQALLLLHDHGDPSCLNALALTPAGGSRFQQALVYTFQDLSPKLSKREEVQVLRKAMRSRNMALQRYAIQRLGALGTPEAIATLREESKRLTGTPLAPVLQTSLEANSAGPDLGAWVRDAKAKAQFWFLSAKSWLRRQSPTTQKILALSPLGLLLLFGAFWMMRRRRRKRLAEEEIQELLRPSNDAGEPPLDSEPAGSLQIEEEEEYATSLYDRE